MQKRHTDRKQYFSEQGRTTEKFVIPFISDCMEVTPKTRVLEIGCGEGGNLTPFAEMGCETMGIDLACHKIEQAKEYFAEKNLDSHATFFCENIYDTDAEKIGKFDLILLRDVIEHIPDQATFMAHLKSFLTPEGKVFFGFPPWQMPFGGHQQTCKSVLSKVPYFHLLPAPLYRGVLRAFGEEKKIKGLMANKSTGISIERFDRILRDTGYHVDKKQLYLINPNYETKFGLKPKEQVSLLGGIPYFRNFVTTCAYYVVSA